MKTNKSGFVLLFLCVFSGACFAFLKNVQARPANITVDSSEIDPFALGDKPEPDERLEFYRDGEMVGRFNEDGEAKLGRTF